MKKIWTGVLLLWAAAPAYALTVQVDLVDSSVKYGALTSTANVQYCEKCTRDVLRAYEWRLWESNYSLRAYVDAIATITVKREKTEVLYDYSLFIEKATEETVKIGGNLLCNVKLKRARSELGFESVTFRAYKQLFISGNTAWSSAYLDEVQKSLPLTLPKKE